MSIRGCSEFHGVRSSRRSFVVASSLGACWANSLAAREQPHKPIRSCILLYMFGGPSHLDTFDLKPKAPKEIRGEFNPIASRTPGLAICELLPRMAAISDRFALIRSMYHRTSNHNPASYYALTGHEQRTDNVTANATANDYPAYGSVVAKYAPARRTVPSAVSLPTMIADGPFRTPGEFAGYLGKVFDPLWILRDPNDARFRVEELELPAGLEAERLERRRRMRGRLSERAATGWTNSDPGVAGLRSYYDRAYDLLTAADTRNALAIEREPAAVRDRFGRTTFGQSTLLARRLVEAGVRFVTVYYSPGIGGWDTHEKNFETLRRSRLPVVDQALSALIEDLSQRGLLEETLVVWMGEFGRTPKINGNAGRDHWPQCYSVLLAGGGVPGGALYGASDSIGAYPLDKPVKPDDLAATIFAKFGIDHRTSVHDHFGRAVQLAYGEPIRALM